MDVNEKIVEEWVRRCRKQFTMVNIRFPVPHNYSDIDILAIDSTGKVYDYEVKWRSVPWVGATPAETVEALVKQLLRTERTETICKLVGKEPNYRILVTPKRMVETNKKQYAKLLIEFEKHGIEIVYFETVLNELAQSVEDIGRYDSEITQLIRMLRTLQIKLEKNN